MLWGDSHASACIAIRNGEVVLKPYCDKAIKSSKLPSTEQRWGESQCMLDLNGNEETGLSKTSNAWDVDDLWCNPVEDLPDPAPNLLDIESSRLLQCE
jgi:hypothetical protein